MSDGDPKILLASVLSYISEISELSFSRLKEHYGSYIREIESHIKADKEELETLCQTFQNAQPREHYLQEL